MTHPWQQWQASLGPRQVGADLETAGISADLGRFFVKHALFPLDDSDSEDRGEESQYRVGTQRMDQGTEVFFVKLLSWVLNPHL